MLVHFVKPLLLWMFPCHVLQMVVTSSHCLLLTPPLLHYEEPNCVSWWGIKWIFQNQSFLPRPGNLAILSEFRCPTWFCLSFAPISISFAAKQMGNKMTTCLLLIDQISMEMHYLGICYSYCSLVDGLPILCFSGCVNFWLTDMNNWCHFLYDLSKVWVHPHNWIS